MHLSVIDPKHDRLTELDKLYPGILEVPDHLKTPAQRRTLSAKQAAFKWAESRLVVYTFDVLGARVVADDAHRRESVFGAFGHKKKGAYGSKNSVHKMKLAQDLPIFKPDAAGRFQYKTKTEDHAEQGEFWRQLAEHTGFDLAWGGDFPSGDGNHFSHRLWGYA